MIKFETEIQVKGYLGILSTWYPMPEMHINSQMLCSGFQITQPWLWFDTNRLVSTIKINENRINTDDVCDRHQMNNYFNPEKVYNVH